MSDDGYLDDADGGDLDHLAPEASPKESVDEQDFLKFQ